jgi:hypothetical protein
MSLVVLLHTKRWEGILVCERRDGGWVNRDFQWWRWQQAMKNWENGTHLIAMHIQERIFIKQALFDSFDLFDPFVFDSFDWVRHWSVWLNRISTFLYWISITRHQYFAESTSVKKQPEVCGQWRPSSCILLLLLCRIVFCTCLLMVATSLLFSKWIIPCQSRLWHFGPLFSLVAGWVAA